MVEELNGVKIVEDQDHQSTVILISFHFRVVKSLFVWLKEGPEINQLMETAVKMVWDAEDSSTYAGHSTIIILSKPYVIFQVTTGETGPDSIKGID